jgi:hypothetical protein
LEGFIGLPPRTAFAKEGRMFIELHLKSDNTPVIIGLSHIVKVAAAASEGGCVIDVAHGGGSIHVAESYADVRRTLEPR